MSNHSDFLLLKESESQLTDVKSVESEAPTTPPPTDGNDVSLEKEYLTLLFHFASLMHECASGRRHTYTNCLQNLVLLDSFPNFRP